jgi:hypothetical protein
MADSEMFISNVVDEDCDSHASTITNPQIQRRSESPEKGLGGVPTFIERTLEWRARVQGSQETTQDTASTRQPQHTTEGCRHASLEIEQIQQRYQELERILEDEIVKHKQRYKLIVERLKDEKVDTAGRWGVQSDYQATECGNDGSR